MINPLELVPINVQITLIYSSRIIHAAGHNAPLDILLILIVLLLVHIYVFNVQYKIVFNVFKITAFNVLMGIM